MLTTNFWDSWKTPGILKFSSRFPGTGSFILKIRVPRGLRSRVVYKFSCTRCNACYIGETIRHFSTCVNEHLSSDKLSNIYKHLESSPLCRKSCSKDCFKITAPAPTPFQLKLKESMDSNWYKPNLSSQVKHIL